MDNNLHWEVVNNDSFDDFHQKLSFLGVRLYFSIGVSYIVAFTNPKLHVNVCNLFWESVIHGLHDGKDFAPN